MSIQIPMLSDLSDCVTHCNQFNKHDVSVVAKSHLSHEKCGRWAQPAAASLVNMCKFYSFYYYFCVGAI
jgi:hypothetical protein